MRCEVKVEGLVVHAFHGVMPQERAVGNEFEIDVVVVYPFEPAFDSDSVDDTLNYAEIVRIVKDEMARPSDLLEHVAGRIHASLLRAFPLISGGRIELRKLTPPIPAAMRSVGVCISW